MSTKTKFTSIFSTEDTPAEEVSALLALTAELAPDAGSDLNWAELQNACPSIGYSRGWLIARRFQLEQHSPEVCERLVKAGKADAETQRAHGNKFHHARMNLQLSWGEIAVRFGVPESYVRACFKLAGVEKDLGLRIGKGGRFAYGDPTLYLENRKAEGAQIPVDVKGRPRLEQLLNYKQEDAPSGTTNAAQRGKTISTIVKLMALRADKATPKEQHEAIDAKVADLMAKHNITVADISKWRAARAAKGKAA